MITLLFILKLSIVNISAFNTDNIKNFEVKDNCGYIDLTKNNIDKKLTEIDTKNNYKDLNNLFQLSCLTYVKIRMEDINKTFDNLNSLINLKELTDGKKGLNTTSTNGFRTSEIYDDIINKLYIKNDKIIHLLCETKTLGFSDSNADTLKKDFTNKLNEITSDSKLNILKDIDTNPLQNIINTEGAAQKAEASNDISSGIIINNSFATDSESKGNNAPTAANSQTATGKLIKGCVTPILSLSEFLKNQPLCNTDIIPNGPIGRVKTKNPLYNPLQLSAIAIFNITDHKDGWPNGTNIPKNWPEDLSDWDNVKKKDKYSYIATLKNEISEINQLTKDIKSKLDSTIDAISDCSVDSKDANTLNDLLEFNNKLIDTAIMGDGLLLGTQFLKFFIEQDLIIPPAYKIKDPVSSCVNLTTNSKIKFNKEKLPSTSIMVNNKYSLDKIKTLTQHLNDAKHRLNNYTNRLAILVAFDSKTAGWWSRMFTNLNNWGLSGDNVMNTAMETLKNSMDNKFAREQLAMQANPCKYMFPDATAAAAISPTTDPTNPTFISARAYCEFMKANGDDPCQKLALVAYNNEAEKKLAMDRCYGLEKNQSIIKASTFGSNSNNNPDKNNPDPSVTPPDEKKGTAAAASTTGSPSKSSAAAFNKPESNDPKYWTKNQYKDGNYVIPVDYQRYRKTGNNGAVLNFDQANSKEDLNSPKTTIPVPGTNFELGVFADQFKKIDALHFDLWEKNKI